MQTPGSRLCAAGALALAAACCLGASAAREPLPGAAPHPAELAARLERAAASRAPDEAPRTRHRRADGSPRYLNRLALEASPYLLQHAHNPVDWYPWGDEAFARAAREEKPVLVSIGYSTCHWCHVMEEESFDDLEIAEFLNRHFVAIKVDREGRPDVDAVYMAAARGLGVAGGWPLNVWLLPDRRPFYAGTYFPPRAGARGASTGFLELLERLRGVYRDQPGRVEELGAGLARELAKAPALPPGEGAPDAGALARAAARLRGDFDAQHGGFGAAPKFPRSLELELLLRYHRRSGDAQALGMVERTLDALAAGGIRDHLGGGFHRYATDAAWRVPHFEKMLYDNALLALVHLDAYQATGREDFARVAREILAYLARDLRAPEGGFYSASDADSEGVEGRYFTWTPAEVERAARDARQARLLRAYYGVGGAGSQGGRSALSVARPLAAVAGELGIPEAEAAALLEDGRAHLLRARLQRVPPHTDRKIVAAWNGLAISAFSRAALVLREPAHAAVAARAAEAIRGGLGSPSLGGRGVRLRRALFEGRADGDGFLDDYAFLGAGALDLFEASRDPAWLRFALALQAELDARFWDAAAGGYFFTADDQERLLARQKPATDGAEPSGNSAAISNLLRLHALTGDERYRERAERSLSAFAAPIARDPAGAPRLLAALDFATDRSKEIVIVSPRPGVEPEALLAALARSFVPNRVLAVVSEGDAQRELAPLVPLVAGRIAREGLPTAYVCERQVCAFPTADPEVFAGQLAPAAPLPEPLESAGTPAP
jgi:uncharacterized protein YyaL (SSP411 family)